MTEQRLTNCFLLHVHKSLTDKLNLTEVAKEFIDQTDERRKYFGTFMYFCILCMYLKLRPNVYVIM